MATLLLCPAADGSSFAMGVGSKRIVSDGFQLRKIVVA